MDINLELLKNYRFSENLDEKKTIMGEIVRKNEGLVWLLVDKQIRRKVNDYSREDAFQEGVIGLMRAVEKFDFNVKTKFTTYATFWIKQSVNRCFYNDRIIHIPEGVLLNKTLEITEVDYGVSGEKIETVLKKQEFLDRSDFFSLIDFLKVLLKKDDIKIFFLVYYIGHTMGEAAKLLNRNRPAVAARCEKIKKKLREDENLIEMFSKIK